MSQNLQTYDKAAYQKLCDTLKRNPKGMTAADVCAASALPLSSVSELITRAADEFSARLKVTESGQIIYSFPDGFKSRYNSLSAKLGRFFDQFVKISGLVCTFLFKIWIMIMLIGYFIIFIALALLTLAVSMAGNKSKSSSSSRRGGGSFYLFNMLLRFMLFSAWLSDDEYDRRYSNKAGRKNRRPLHKSIFSFVFGEENTDAANDKSIKKAVIAYIQSRKGVISLPEYMAITGEAPIDADASLLAFCAEYKGSPEATEDGTIVYRFDDLLLRAETKDRSFSGFSAPITPLKLFSGNTKTMNTWIGIINTVNLIFGSYFFFNTLAFRAIETQEAFTAFTSNVLNKLYIVSFTVVNMLSAGNIKTEAIISVLFVVLGIIPIIFSVFFWLIPLIRNHLLKISNEKTKMKNFRRIGVNYIWSNPAGIKETDITTQVNECKPKSIPAAQKQVFKEVGTYSVPDISVDSAGSHVYAFNELKREKDALEQYRSKVNIAQLGNVVFDSAAQLT